MKTKSIFFALSVLAFVMIASAFGGYDAGDAATGKYYRKAFTKDTITNAANDTLAVPVNLLSLYTYDYTLVKTNISGTTALKLYLQESNLTSGNTDWLTIDSSVVSTTTTGRIKGTDVFGVRHRLIVDGSGTQSSSYNLQATLKRKN